MSKARFWATTAMAALAVGGPALAQVDLRTLRDQNLIVQQQDIAQQNALGVQREAAAAQGRFSTQLTLRDLALTPTTPVSPSLRPTLPAAPPRGASADDYAAQAERMDRLTDARLAQSSARLSAIRPAQ
ncbi:hypothetical protein [Caulobacter sp. DWP3-1-3b2]|uniref:hypothetical protein n=1 Tax=Caulobacter sp. DWP3-1-3b2 TaxID=2804643 RepID=UPI003CECBAD2